MAGMENVKKEVARIDKLDSKEDQKVSVIEGKEGVLTTIYIKKVANLLPKLDKIQNEKAREGTKKEIFEKLKSINRENIETEANAFNEEIDRWTKSAEEECLVNSEVDSAKTSIENDLETLIALKSTSPEEAYRQAILLKEKIARGMNGDFSKLKIDEVLLKEFPELKKSLEDYFKAAFRVLTETAQEIVSQNKDVLQYREDAYVFYGRTKGYIASLKVLFGQIQNGQTPSEMWVAQIRKEGEAILNGPLLKSLQFSPARRFIQNLKIFDGKDEFEKSLNIISTNFKESEKMTTGYVADVRRTCNKISNTTGESWKTDAINFGKTVLITTAAVAGAIATGGLFAAALGGGLVVGGAAVGGIAGVAANIGATSIVTGFGAMYGGRLANTAIEGDARILEDRAGMMKEWTQGAAMSGAGRVVGMVGGTVLGKGGAAIANASKGALGKKAAESVAKYGEKMVETSFKMGNAPTMGLKAKLAHAAKSLAEETQEELVEDTLQKIGEGMAPTNPTAGFMLSMIPSMLRQSRTSFTKGMGDFKVNTNISGKVGSEGVEFKYTDKASAISFLTDKGAPKEVVTALEKGVVVDVTVNGVRIKMDEEVKAKEEEPSQQTFSQQRGDVEEQGSKGLKPINESDVETDEGRKESGFIHPSLLVDKTGGDRSAQAKVPFKRIESMAAVLRNAKAMDPEEFRALSVEKLYQRVTGGLALSGNQAKLALKRIKQHKLLIEQGDVIFDHVNSLDAEGRRDFAKMLAGKNLEIEHDVEFRRGNHPGHVVIIVEDTDYVRFMENKTIVSWNNLTESQRAALSESSGAAVNLDVGMGNISLVKRTVADNEIAYDDLLTHEEEHFLNKTFELRRENKELHDVAKGYFKKGEYGKYLETKFAAQLNWMKDEILAYRTDHEFKDPDVLRAQLGWDGIYGAEIRGGIQRVAEVTSSEDTGTLTAEYKAKYEQALDQALASIKGFDSDEMFTVTPIEWWPKLNIKLRTDKVASFYATPLMKHLESTFADEQLSLTPEVEAKIKPLLDQQEQALKTAESMPIQYQEKIKAAVSNSIGLSTNIDNPRVNIDVLLDSFNSEIELINDTHKRVSVLRETASRMDLEQRIDAEKKIDIAEASTLKMGLDFDLVSLEEEMNAPVSELSSLREEFDAKQGKKFSDFTPEIEVRVRQKLEQLTAMENEAQALPSGYRDIALRTIQAHREETITNIRKMLGRNSRVFDAAVKKGKDLVGPITKIYTEFQDLKVRAEALPKNIRDFIEIRIVSEENRIFDTYERSRDYQGATRPLHSLISKAEKSPEAFSFALEKLDRESIEVEEVLDLMIEHKEVVGVLEPVMNQFAENESLLRSHPQLSGEGAGYNGLNGAKIDIYSFRTRELQAASDALVEYRALDERLASAKSKGEIEKILRDAKAIKGRLGRLDYSKSIDRIKNFDKRVMPITKAENVDGVASMYRRLVMRGEMSQEDFTSRLEALNEVREKIDLPALQSEGRVVEAKNIQESLDNFLREEVIERGSDPEQLRQEVEQGYEQVRSTARITINVNHKALVQIFKDGEFKTYSENGDGRRDGKRSDYTGRRAKADEKLGYEERFVVGALSSSNGFDEYLGAAPFYGHGAIELDSAKIKDRIVFVEGDSMTPGGTIFDVMPDWIMRKWENVESRKMDFEGAMLSKALMDLSLRHRGLTHTNNLYVEAHILGGVKVGDIKGISYATMGSSPEKVAIIKDVNTQIHSIDPLAPEIEIMEFNGDIANKEQSGYGENGPSHESLIGDEGF